TGNYNQKNSIYCSGKEPEVLIASMLHETQHFMDKLIFGQNKQPFRSSRQSQFVQVKEDVVRRSLTFPELTPQDKLIKQSFLSAHRSYKESEQMAEVLVKVPKVIGLLGM
ncbi:TPA: hypothetical protein ACTXXA_003660, partial [Legionella anisa]